MSAEKHVVVVGAGIVGLCAADALLSRGFRVTVLERDDVTGDGCSYGNGGIIVPSHFVPLAAPGMVQLGMRMLLNRQSPFGIESLTDLGTLGWLAAFARAATKSHVERCAPLLRDLNLGSRDEYERLIGELGIAVGYERRGLLMLSRTQRAHDAEASLAEEANRLGLKASLLTRDDLAKLEPDLSMDVAGAVHFEDDAHLTPSALMGALRARVVGRGAEVCDGVPVGGFRIRQGSIEAVVVPNGEIVADEFVLAAGAWSGELSRSLRLRMPMIAGKGYGLTVASPPQRPRIPAILTEARVAVTPMTDGVRFVGTMELGKPVSTPTSPRVEGMRRSISAYYPAYTPEHLDSPVWCGFRPCSPDGLPYIGRTASAANLVVAAGHAMMGMSLGPVTGKLVAEVVAGVAPSHALDLLSPDRFA
jgi:D-amino-acid dehydrogenase